jgi:hypothetical protein
LRDAALFLFGQLGVARSHFGAGFFDQRIEEVVSFDAKAFTARDLDERTLGVFRIRRGSEAQLARRRMRERHHLVREVM